MKTFIPRCPLFIALGLVASQGMQAQYTTPNTGQSYTLTDLAVLSGGVITATSDTSYLQTADLTVAATDTLLIDEDLVWQVADSASISIAGTFIAAPPEQAFITAAIADLHHQGMRFEQGAAVNLQRMSIMDGGSIKCLTANLHLYRCTISNQVSNASTGAALELPSGKVYIDHVTFADNERAAISSAANGAAAPQITNCTFLHNGFGNTNRPQINLGPSGADTTLIRNNTVIGNTANTLVGGIAFSSLLGNAGHVVIDSNLVQDNRYGITMTGSNITGRIADNTILDNNTQGNPAQGGSGINLNGGATNVSMISGNQITGSLWGITLQGSVTTNLGDTATAAFNPGENSFSDNGNGGVIYALYNNTPNPVPAMNNCWDYVNPMTDPDSIAAVIFDVADDASLGEVTYVPFSNCGITTGIGNRASEESPLNIFPNPSNGKVTITSTVSIDSYAVYNAGGQLVRSVRGPVQGQWSLGDLDAGLYLLKATTANGVEYTQRIVVQ